MKKLIACTLVLGVSALLSALPAQAIKLDCNSVCCPIGDEREACIWNGASMTCLQWWTLGNTCM